MKSVVVMLILIPVVAARADSVNFINQHNQWALNPSYACNIDVDNPDTTFGQESADQTVWAEDDVGAVSRVILVDIAWDTIFGYGPEKIPNPSQVDSCIIDSAYFKYYVHGSSTTADSIIFWRLHTDIENDDTYATWNNPKSGQNWGGGGGVTLASDVIHDDDSVLYNNATTSTWDSTKITDIWQTFTDSIGRRTGIAITIPTNQSETLRLFHNVEAGYFILRVWWNEYGVKSTAIDSQKVAVRDSYINHAQGKGHYNYGDAGYIFSGYFSSTVWGRIIVGVENMADSLGDNLSIDSARFHFKLNAQMGSPTINCHKIIQWWREGTGSGFGSVCGVDWYHTQHATGSEGCQTNYNWATAGCDNTTTDRESSAFATVSVSGTGWYEFAIPDSIAQGMYDNRKLSNPTRGNYNGVRMALADEDNDYIKMYSAEAFQSANRPWWMFYWSEEVEPEEIARRPASIDEPIAQGAYIK